MSSGWVGESQKSLGDSRSVGDESHLASADDPAQVGEVEGA